MPAFFLHNLFGTGDPIKDFVLVLIIIALFFVSHYFIFRGAIYLVRFWKDFSPRWKLGLKLAPAVMFLLISCEPIHIGWFSFPFSVFGWFPVIFFMDHESLFQYYLVGGIGSVVNLFGVVGVGAFIEKKLGKAE